MVRVNLIIPKSYFETIKPKFAIEMNGETVTTTVIRSTFTADGAHFVVDVPSDVDPEEFIRVMSSEGAKAFRRALVVVDRDLCIECGECTAECAYEALVLDQDFHLVVNKDNCTGCRACTDACPRHCITVH
jgi:Na+-translocating ferredoxin:NAD+ oxidoreductase RNF subunit RnfB